MASASNTSKGKNILWTEEMSTITINVLLEEVAKGHKGDNGFHSSSYTAVSKDIKEKLGISVSKENVQNHIKTWKTRVAIANNFLSSSGFGYNVELEQVVADPLVWEDYFKAHPNEMKYRTKKFPRHYDLCLIVGKDTATGQTAFSGNSVPVDQSSENMINVEESEEVDDAQNSESMNRGIEEPTKSRSTTSVRTQPRKRKNRDIKHEIYGQLASAVNRLASTMEENSEFSRSKLLFKAIESVDGLDEDQIPRAYSILIQSRKKAIEFWGLPKDRHAQWLRSVLDGGH